jgi:hypothetical protein
MACRISISGIHTVSAVIEKRGIENIKAGLFEKICRILQQDSLARNKRQFTTYNGSFGPLQSVKENLLGSK